MSLFYFQNDSSFFKLYLNQKTSPLHLDVILETMIVKSLVQEFMQCFAGHTFFSAGEVRFTGGTSALNTLPLLTNHAFKSCKRSPR
jgi:hypothetical protein